MNDYIQDIIKDTKKIKMDYTQDSLTVEEALNLPALSGYKILAGIAGLQKKCKHMTILETPSGINWLEGGEFLLTAGYAFAHNEEHKKNMIMDAYKRGVSAIAIKDNRYFGEISEELIIQANKYEMPLITIPYEVVYTRTISSFYDMLFYRKNEYILNINNIYKKLLDLSFENKDIGGIIYSVANLSNANVFLFDESFNIISNHIIDAKICAKVSKYEPFNKHGISIIKDIRGHIINNMANSCYISIYPIVGIDSIVAYLYIVDEVELDKISQSAIEYGISIISIKLERDRATSFAQIRFNKTLVDIMLNNKELPDDFYENTENNLGWHNKDKIVGVCMRIHPNDGCDSESYKYNIHNGFKNILNVDNYLSTDKKSEVFVFLKVYSEDYLDDIISMLISHFKTYEDSFIISFGISNQYVGIKNIEQLYNESYLAALFSKKDIIYFNSLDTIKLLYPLKDDKEIHEYYERTIKKLEQYDNDNDINLMETLETYLKYNLKKTMVANKLFIHVETLRYRLRRIEEITGYSLDDSEGLFALQMGIKLKRLIKVN